METIKRSVVAGREGGREGMQSTEDFQNSAHTLNDIIMMDTCHYTFVQTHRIYNPTSEP